MRIRRVPVYAVPLLLAGTASGLLPAVARTEASAVVASFSARGQLDAVATVSARLAWAVGSTGAGKTLILRWNGTAWKREPIPSPGASSLSGVAAVSARLAWAVGSTGTGKTLILRWNGTAWKRVASPDARGGSFLTGVAASAGGAWASGYADVAPNGCGTCKTLTLRSGGAAWRRVPSPSPPGGALTGVSTAPGGGAWAVGDNGLGSQTLILRWQHGAWARVPSPSPGILPFLSGVSAASAASAWAVGGYRTASGNSICLILHWNGSRWD